jgi:two-component system response regulator AtoC
MLALIADDEPAVRKIVAALCARLGLAAETCESGPKALAAARRLRPGVVICDLRMPGEFDGLEACRRIRREMPQTAIIMMTGDPADAESLRDAGFTTLVKPFAAEAMAGFIAKLLA